MPIRPAPRRALLPAVLALAVLAAGCGSDEDEAPAGPQTSTTSSPGGDATPSASASESASASASPAVAPATGPVVESDAFTAHLPKGWELDDRNSGSTLALGYDSSTGASLTMGFFPAASESTLDSYERASLKVWGYDEKPKIRPRVDVNGVEMFHHTADRGAGRVVEVYGAPHAGVSVKIEFHLPGTITAPDQRTLVESVLASIEWA